MADEANYVMSSDEEAETEAMAMEVLDEAGHVVSNEIHDSTDDNPSTESRNSAVIHEAHDQPEGSDESGSDESREAGDDEASVSSMENDEDWEQRQIEKAAQAMRHMRRNVENAARVHWAAGISKFQHQIKQNMYEEWKFEREELCSGPARDFLDSHTIQFIQTPIQHPIFCVWCAMAHDLNYPDCVGYRQVP